MYVRHFVILEQCQSQDSLTLAIKNDFVLLERFQFHIARNWMNITEKKLRREKLTLLRSSICS